MAFIFLDRKTVGIGTIVLAISFILGIIIGYFGKDTSNVHQMTPRMAKALSDFESSTTDQFLDEKDLIEQVLNDVNPESIRSYLQEITKEPHIAAQERDEELIQWIKKTWEEVGLDHVDLAIYDLYLSWPNKESVNSVVHS